MNILKPGISAFFSEIEGFFYSFQAGVTSINRMKGFIACSVRWNHAIAIKLFEQLQLPAQQTRVDKGHVTGDHRDSWVICYGQGGEYASQRTPTLDDIRKGGDSEEFKVFRSITRDEEFISQVLNP